MATKIGRSATTTARDRRPQILNALSKAFSGRCVQATKISSPCFQMEPATAGNSLNPPNTVHVREEN